MAGKILDKMVHVADKVWNVSGKEHDRKRKDFMGRHPVGSSIYIPKPWGEGGPFKSKIVGHDVERDRVKTRHGEFHYAGVMPLNEEEGNEEQEMLREVTVAPENDEEDDEIAYHGTVFTYAYHVHKGLPNGYSKQVTWNGYGTRKEAQSEADRLNKKHNNNLHFVRLHKRFLEEGKDDEINEGFTILRKTMTMDGPVLSEHSHHESLEEAQGRLKLENEKLRTHSSASFRSGGISYEIMEGRFGEIGRGALRGAKIFGATGALIGGAIGSAGGPVSALAGAGAGGALFGTIGGAIGASVGNETHNQNEFKKKFPKGSSAIHTSMTGEETKVKIRDHTFDGAIVSSGGVYANVHRRSLRPLPVSEEKLKENKIHRFASKGLRADRPDLFRDTSQTKPNVKIRGR